MTSQDLRKLYLAYFEKKGHSVIPSASLIPQNDPTVLFTTAGMHPLVPYLVGEKHPMGKRLASSQKCMRTGDIDEVGDNVHHTFFEMLGNWSLGDYFKNEAIEMSFEFLTSSQYLNLPIEKLAVSVFAGDKDAPFDSEAYDKWVSLGITPERIAKLPKKNNWWGPAGQTGPCGPDTEMFYWTGQEAAPKNFQETCDDPRWVEIWNDVFMQYNKSADGIYQPLSQKNVDTGMGLERALAVINGFDDNYLTDLFSPIIKEIEKISGKSYSENTKEFRIIADHLKAATFAIADGALPSNKGAGYITRRLIRRAIVKAHQLGIQENFTTQIAESVFSIYSGIYFSDEQSKNYSSSEVEKQNSIKDELEKEETKFKRTLAQGLKQFAKEKDHLTGEIAFNLYQTYGFPLEMTIELANEENINVDIDEFQKAFKAHQDLSRTASAGVFKGGLADASEQTTRLHTAAHLLLAALRQVLGDHVTQKGSNITAERLRFDFSHPEKMTPEQIKQTEDLVNQQIAKKLPVALEEMSLEDAKKAGAMGVFESKYGQKVKVYTIGQSATDYFSKEICGGPHVTNTSQLGQFKITKEESSSSGIRRIKAILC